MINDNTILNYQFIDVRNPGEFSKGTIKGAKNLPLHLIRESVSELDPLKEIVLFCQKGMRGYLAEKILLQHGFKVKNLAGGYKLWDMYVG